MVIRAPRNLRRLQTASEVIDALGGTQEAAKILAMSPQGVSMAKARGTFSPGRFLIVLRELRGLGYVASPTLWGIEAPQGLRVIVE
jgi:hypothetical protein